MLWIIGFLTGILVLDSLFLILLVLVQLPKKDAGLGQAFGASATDALFGAGSGNALTKMTKYSTGIFFGLTLVIYLMYNHHAHSSSVAYGKRVQQAGREVETTPSTPASDANKAAGSIAGKTAADANKAATSVSNATAGQLGTTIGTNVSAPASIPATKNTNIQGLLTVPQAAPTPTNPPKTPAPASEAPKPAAPK